MRRLRNLITDVAGVRVGHADDAKLGSGVTAIVFDAAGGRERRRARRRAGHARDRAARSGADGRAHRRHRAVRRLGLRPRCRLRRAGLAARAGPRLCGARGARADRAGRDPVRPAQRRRQELGPLSALSRARLRGRESRAAPISRSAASARASAPPPSISRAASARPRRRRATASRSARSPRSMPPAASTIGDGPHFWAAPFEQNKEFGGRGLPAPFPADALAFRSKGAPRREHHARGGRDRRRAHQGADASASRSWRRTGSRARSTRCTRRSTATWCSPPRPGAKPLADPVYSLSELGMVAANVLARAIARGVYEATALPFAGALPSWKRQVRASRETAPPDKAPDRRTALSPAIISAISVPVAGPSVSPQCAWPIASHRPAGPARGRSPAANRESTAARRARSCRRRARRAETTRAPSASAGRTAPASALRRAAANSAPVVRRMPCSIGVIR